jgi:cytochrome c-type biogenesis protein CcmH/NrfF
MPLELWIVLALALVAGMGLAIARIRRKRRAEPVEEDKNVYPLF